MPLYLSQQTLKEAIDRLSVCAAASRTADYLIFKRALKLAVDSARAAGLPEPTSVVTGTKAPAFVQAVADFTLRVPPGNLEPSDVDNPYYMPFGSKRDDTLGYRTVKFPSNGSSDTIGRWQSRSGKPLTLVSDTKPKAYSFEPRTKTELENFFGVKGAAEHFSGEKPRLLDTAIWWFRFTDLQSRFGGEPTSEQLAQAFIEDLSLSDVEISALFLKKADVSAEQLTSRNVELREEV
jgi:hypothetical protein